MDIGIYSVIVHYERVDIIRIIKLLTVLSIKLIDIALGN
ncbi:hypothetical protein Cyast_0770 [Cyanobacterium stanieri PCC 7202]|uniref:Uncharacterized protein n=1 Tax=Cyanobacterium stanieri (strain ATCC 29140 / PCC 7202) TaxID=292563 RepID=K9YJV1_CYASC|nr:hypothetical protein Cyast_0770 [Cyanobacterium stanieri PCC 7202]